MQNDPEFSLINGGYFFRLLLRLGLIRHDAPLFGKRILVIITLTWFPLLILSLITGVAFGNKVDVPFLVDFVTQIRFLVSIPLLIIAEKTMEICLGEYTHQLVSSGIIPPDQQPRFETIKSGIKKLNQSGLAEIILLILVTANIAFRWLMKTSDMTAWMMVRSVDEVHISLPGMVYIFFSLPIFQFLWLRWIWRWIIWFIYFFRIAQLKLRLNPAHPDKAGGLGFFGIPPAPFSTITLALSIVFSGMLAEQIYFFKEPLRNFYGIMVVFVIICIIINSAPLLLFIPTLIRARRKGFYAYSELIQRHHQHFDEKWLHSDKQPEILGEPDPSSLTDLNSTFASVMDMRFVPFNIRIMISTIMISIIPMLPLFAFEFPVKEILVQLIKMLI